MTAPARARAKPTTSPSKRGKRPGREPVDDRGSTRSTRGTGSGSRSSAAERAYARRAQRAEQAKRAASGDSGSGDRSAQGLRSMLRLRLPRSRASFVLMIMAMLAAGVVVTLWLSTQAIAGSYKLERLHKTNGELHERASQLERVVTKRESAPWLAKHAQQVGMVPGQMPAKLVVHPDGSVTMVGEPHKATGSSSEAEKDSDEGEHESSAGEGDETGQDTASAGEER